MPAFSLIETVLVLAIGFVLLALGVPILSRVADEGQAHLMASRLTSQFMMARRVAQLTHRTC